jgi:hypothetical protein
MDASLATYQARLATFQGAAGATKTRRTSSRSKKAAPKSKAAWPLAAPSAEDLAFAGFVWRPTSASPDNVQCWACNCQLDGWEEADVPTYEHLTHSPSCGFAVVTAIRLRFGDPGRTEEDPVSDQMIAARQETFGDIWPLDAAAGFPSVQQLAAAGWFYDPAEDTPDGVTCAYCHLALDAWDAGDDPLEEHRRRAPDCLFFALTELYHPATKPAPKKPKRVTKSKRASTRSSSVSDATTTTTTKKKATRSSSVSDAATTTTKKKKGTRSSTVSNATTTTTTTTKKKPTRSSTVSNATTTTTAPKKATRGKKRTSEAIEDDPHFSEIVQDTSKRMRFSSMSSLPDDLPVGTPKKTPTYLEVEPFTMSSLPGSLLVGTPKRTPSHLREAEDNGNKVGWQPTDMDAFFSNQRDIQGFMNGVIIDSGLDELTVTGTTPEEIQAAVLAGLTDAEKDMTIEQWVLYNAKRGEEKLRMACEQQILAFEAEGKRALATLEAIPIH